MQPYGASQSQILDRDESSVAADQAAGGNRHAEPGPDRRERPGVADGGGSGGHQRGYLRIYGSDIIYSYATVPSKRPALFLGGWMLSTCF